LTVFRTVTLARSNSALPDDGDYTETFWNCFNVNFNIPFPKFLTSVGVKTLTYQLLRSVYPNCTSKEGRQQTNIHFFFPNASSVTLHEYIVRNVADGDKRAIKIIIVQQSLC
jgi:hypothetical protein